MVQIIPRQPSRLESIMQSLSRGTAGLAEGGQALRGAIDERQTRNALADRFGEEFKNVKNPQIQQLLLQGVMRKQQEEAKRQSELAELEQSYPIIEKRFGKETADLFKSLPVGAQTELIKSSLQNESRNLGLKAQFGGEDEGFQDQGFPEEESDTIEPIQRQKAGLRKPMDFDRGLTPAERVKRQEARYKTNLPLFTESADRLRSLENERDDLAILEDLSPRISGLERLNINPKTGDLIIPGAASEDAQRYAKTINNFTRNAKDTYGSRITNFDLQQFLKRLPTLANSKEGRHQIIRQMQIINDINLAHDQSLQDVVEEHGGIRQIDYDRAVGLAEKRSKKKISALRSQYKNIGTSLDKEFESEVKKFKSIVPKDHVAVQKADGSTGFIPKDKVKAFMQIEGNRLL